MTMLVAFIALFGTLTISKPIDLAVADTTAGPEFMYPYEGACFDKNQAGHSATANKCDFSDSPHSMLSAIPLESIPSYWSGTNASSDPNIEKAGRRWVVSLQADACDESDPDGVYYYESFEQYFWQCANGGPLGGSAHQYGTNGCQWWIIPQLRENGTLDWDYMNFKFRWDVNGVRQNPVNGSV